MDTLPTPTASRLRPASWKDARLLLGLSLVLGSIVLGVLTIGAADDRVGVWAADQELTPGDPIREDQLRRVDVHLGSDTASYLRAGQALPESAVVDRPLRPGELVPRSALIDPSSLGVRAVPVHVDPIYLTALSKGTQVSVYAVAPDTGDPDDSAGTAGSGRADDQAPEYVRVLERVTVQGVGDQRGGMLGASGSSASATILVPEDEVIAVMGLSKPDTPLKLVPERGAPSGDS